MDSLADAEEEEIVDEIEQSDAYRGKLQLAVIDLETVLVDKPPAGIPPSGARSGEAREEEHGAGARTPTRDISDRHSSPPLSPPLSPPSSPFGCRGPRVKLPKLVLRKFTGDQTEWTTFWDSFESTVHTNPELTSVDKFNYSHSLLDKAAAEAVSGLKLTAANYEEVVAILKQRFGNKQQIVNKHMEALLSLEPATSHNLKSLRQFFPSKKVRAGVRVLAQTRANALAELRDLSLNNAIHRGRGVINPSIARSRAVNRLPARRCGTRLYALTHTSAGLHQIIRDNAHSYGIFTLRLRVQCCYFAMSVHSQLIYSYGKWFAEHCTCSR